MGGCLKTSTHDVMARDQLSPCLKLKTQESALEDTLTLSGHLQAEMLLIAVRCYSTHLARDTSLTKDLARRFFVTALMGLVS